MADASAGRELLPDLSECAREPIQFLGRVQHFGCLLVISNDWVVQNASANAGAVLGVEAGDLVGTRLTDHLGHEAVHTLRGKVQTLSGGDESARVFGVDLRQTGALHDVAIHRSGRSYVVEFERKPEARQRDDMSLVQPLLARVRKGATIQEMCQAVSRGVMALTGFARVMVYRFEPDHHGIVVAESRALGMDSYRGLHFPAGDIPPQARELYRRSLLRIIPNVEAPTSPLVPERHPEGAPVDLSLAVTRAVSPVHLEYLRNMGVAASMSVSILRDGELWGLVACHHPVPRHIDYETRSAVELFAQLVSYELGLREARLAQERVARAHELHERLVMLFEAGLDLGEGLGRLAEEIGSVIDFDGIAMHDGDRFYAEGLAPTEAEVREVERHLARASQGQVFATEHLEASCPGAVPRELGICGLMALPLKRHPRQFLMLFRREVAQSVVWAGNPTKVSTEGGRISPRRSFAAWRETVQERSLPWTPAERRAAEVLRVTLLELVLKLTSNLNAVGQRRSQTQEVVISELNHRLRNVFGLLSGLVSQISQVDPADGPVAAFAGDVGGRIRALARAHDQLTRAREGHFSLAELIHDEVAAFAGGAERVTVAGGDVRLPAAAGATLSLVVHELVTNAVKHGALSRPEGRVLVSFEPAPGGGVAWTWAESGGPPVVRPERVGFGSTLIARSIPHELDGMAEVDYHPDGFRARFVLPSRQADLVESRPPARLVAEAGEAARRGLRLRGTVLVVEDNVIIAMNAADALRGLGADEVLIAGSNREALRLLDAHPVALAILDVDLGGQTSAPTAARLRERGVPFLLATGYDPDRAARDAGIAPSQVLTKPYSNDGIADVLTRITAASGT